jgi:PadR family transcriptional regulator, regulatory protein PadR
MAANEKFGPMRKGLLEFLILKVIDAERVYVADILCTLRDTEFATQAGTLYPLLSRMRRDGLLDHDWKESASGPPRKYYALTAAGQTQLAELVTYWRRINKTIEDLGAQCL